jgi:hypothetical protein
MRARRVLFAILLGSLLATANHLGVIAGMADPPPGYQPAYYIRNLDVPQYVTWIELAKTHWLLANEHAPWLTEPALFQPMFLIAARTGLPTVISYYGLQLLMYWLAAYALLFAARTFLRTRRAMLYAALAILGALPLQMIGWAFAKALHWKLGTVIFGYGLVEYGYDSADGLVRGGLSNSIVLTFGTAMALFAFANLARFVADGRRSHYRWLLACLFLDGLFHPFEVYVVAFAALWPLWKRALKWECLWLFMAAGVGMTPYLIETMRSPWLRDISQISNWKMGSPVWVLLVFGLPAIAAFWLMLIRPRAERPEDEVLQWWFVWAAILPLIPAIPAGMHHFDGYMYAVGFLLVRKAQSDKLITRLFTAKPNAMRLALVGWGAVSAITLGIAYAQLWKDGKSAHPDFLSAVAPREEVAMIAWMKANLPHDKLVLAPEDMAPWIAAIPMPAVASHDIFSLTYHAQERLAGRFYRGEPVRKDLIDGFGVSYIVAPAAAPIDLPGGKLLHEETPLRLYEVPGESMKPYPGLGRLNGTPPNRFWQWMFHQLGEIRRAV